VKVNFFNGASLEDPKGMFNAGLDAKKTRAIDFSEADRVNASELKELVRAAVAYNLRSEGKKYPASEAPRPLGTRFVATRTHKGPFKLTRRTTLRSLIYGAMVLVAHRPMQLTTSATREPRNQRSRRSAIFAVFVCESG
jgi:Domain of unknown function (DU1801)